MRFRVVLLPYVWVGIAIVGWMGCSGSGGSQEKTDARPAAFRDADIYDTADAPESVAPPLPDCPASCDDKNPCTVDSCDPDTHLCRNTPGNEGVPCTVADLCSLEPVCKAGLCVGSRSKDCSTAPDACHKPGYCVPATGACTFEAVDNGQACNDNNLCTTGDQCLAGVCQGAAVQCGPGVTCDPKTGECPGFPTAKWGLALDAAAGTTGAFSSSFSDITVSASGALYFTAGYANTLDLGAGATSTLSTAGQPAESLDYNAVVARLNPATGRALWQKSWGDRARQSGSSVAANSKDTVLVSGVYGGQMDLGPVSGIDAGALVLTNSTSFPKVFFVAMEGSSGRVNWALATEMASSDLSGPLFTRVIVDPADDNFVLCGSPNTLAKGLGVTSAGGKGDVLIAKLNANDGRILWAGQYGSAADESCDAIAADGRGKLYVTGHLAKGSALDLGNGVKLSGPSGTSQQSVYLAQLDSIKGQALAGKAFASQGKTTGKLYARTVATDGNVVWLGGSFTYSAVFDAIALTSLAGSATESGAAPDAPSAFIVALDSNTWSEAWAQRWGLNAEIDSLSPTASGNLIAGGYYMSGMSFDSGKLADSVSSPVPFVAKLNGASGHAVAARGYASASASSSSAFQTVVVDRFGTPTPSDESYGLGVLGSASAGIDMGSPVGYLAGESLLDAGALSGGSTLFLVKLNP
jgi:hypothetical protein